MKNVCRWCGNPIRKSGKAWRHAQDDKGQCDAFRRRMGHVEIEPA